MAVQNGASMPPLALPPLKGGGGKYAVQPLGAFPPGPAGVPRAMKCLAAWAAVMTLLCAVTGAALWVVSGRVQTLQADLRSLAAAGQADMTSTNGALARLQLASVDANHTAILALRSAVADAEVGRAQLAAHLDQLREEVAAALEQRRLQQAAAVGCQPGEGPGPTGAGCVACGPGAYSEAGSVCLPCPVGTWPDSTASTCAEVSGAAMEPDLPAWLAVDFQLSDLLWVTDGDAKQSMLLSIAQSLQLPPEAIVRELMVPTTGQVVFEVEHGNGTTVQSYADGVRYALWNLAFLNPGFINVTECGLRCIRQETLVSRSSFGGPIARAEFSAALAALPGVERITVDSYTQISSSSAVLPGTEMQFSGAEGAARQGQFTGAVASILGLSATLVNVMSISGAERGRDAVFGQYDRRRRLQSDFFSIVQIDYRLELDYDISPALHNLTADPELLIGALNDAGDVIEATLGATNRIREMASTDLIVGQPDYNTSIEFTILSEDGAQAEQVVGRLVADLPSALNQTGQLTSYTHDVLERQLLTSPLPLPPPPTPVFMDAFSISTYNLSTGKLQVAEIAAITGTLMVKGNSTFDGDVDLNGTFSASGDVIVEGMLDVLERSTFGGMVSVNSSFFVTGAAQIGGSVEVGSLVSSGGTFLQGSSILGSSAADALRISAHIESESLTFDADHSLARTGTGSFSLAFPDPLNETQTIVFPDESGVVLTTGSSITVLGAVVTGSLAAGFGQADVAGLSVSGQAVIRGDVQLGSQQRDRISVSGSIVSPELFFDADSDGCGTIVSFDAPNRSHRLTNDSFLIRFPSENGSVLTTASTASKLTSVGGVSSGSLAPGFGSANVSTIFVRRSSSFMGDVQISSSGTDRITVRGHFADPIMTFDQDSDGFGLHVHHPDPSVDQHVTFPNETGTLLTDASTFSRLEHLGQVTSGSLGDGFGSASVTSLQTSGLANFTADVIIGSNNSRLALHAAIQTNKLVFDADGFGGNFSLAFPDPDDASLLTFPSETGTILSDVSANSSLEKVGTLISGSLGETFGHASVAGLESRGASLLRHDVVIGDGANDSLTIDSTITSTLGELAFGFEHHTSLLLSIPNHSDTVMLTVAAENGSLLTSSSQFSALATVGTLTGGSIAGEFGDIVTPSDIILTNESSVLRTSGKLVAVGNSTFGDESSDEQTVVGRIVVTNGSAPVFTVDSNVRDVIIDGNLHIDGNLVPGQDFRSLTFGVSTITEYTTGAGVSVEGVTFSNGTIPILQTSELKSSVQDAGIAIDGMLVKDGRLYVTGLCLRSSTDNMTANQTIEGGGDGCYILDADRQALSVSENTITSDKIKKGAIETENLANGSVTSEKLKLTQLDLEHAGGVGFFSTNRWVLEAICVNATGHVLDTMEDVAECTTAVAPTGNDWRTDGGCLSGSRRCSELTGAVDNCAPGRCVARGLECELIAAVSATNETDCEYFFAPSGHRWSMEECLNSSDLEHAIRVTPASGFACDETFFAPRQQAVHVTSGVCVDDSQADVQFHPSLASENECVNMTVQTGNSWNNSSMCISRTNRFILETNSSQCTSLPAPTGNSWLTGGSCVSDDGIVHADKTWLGACEGTQTLEIMTLTNTARGPTNVSVGAAASGGNTETQVKFKHSYVEADDPLGVATITVGAEGNFYRLGSYMSFGTAIEGEIHERMRISAGGSVDVHGGEMNVRGDFSTGYGPSHDVIKLGADVLDTVTIGARLAQGSLLVDANGDGDNILNITFPSAAAAHTIQFPAESGVLLTTASNFSGLTAFGSIASGSLAKGFGRAAVESLASFYDTELSGNTSVGDDPEDRIAVTGFVTTDMLIFDTDDDGQCLVLMFDDPLSLEEFAPTTWVFTQSHDDIMSPFYGHLAEYEPTIFVLDTARLEWQLYDNVHLAHYDPNLKASCPTNLQTALGAPWGDFDSVDLELAGSFNYTLSIPGTYCIGGRNLETTRLALHVDVNPFFGYVPIEITVFDGAAPDELAWTLVDDGGLTVLEMTGSSSSPSLDALISVAPDGQNYTWRLTDSRGNGISSPGYYRVTVDGEAHVVATGSRATGMTSAVEVTFSVPSRVVPVPSPAKRALPATPGHPVQGLGSDGRLAHCHGDTTHTVRFPEEDGRLLVKHQGQTVLNEDVRLGEAGGVYFDGPINGTLRFEPDHAVILGRNAMRFGGDLWGELNETIGEYCFDHDEWAVGAGPYYNCSHLVLSMAQIGLGCDADTGFGFAENFYHCPESCGICVNHSSPYIRTGYSLTLAVPEPTADHTLTLPHETGTLLSNSSTTSTLTAVGSLIGLRVEGSTTLAGPLSVGLPDRPTESVVFEATLSGAVPFRFDGGVAPPSGDVVQICGDLGIASCTGAADSETGMFPARLAYDGTLGGPTPNRWMSLDSSPFHWFAVHLGRPHWVTRMRVYPSRTAYEPGQLCSSALRYRPHTPGAGYLDFGAQIGALDSEIADRPEFEAHIAATAADGWLTAATESTPSSLLDWQLGSSGGGQDGLLTELLLLDIDQSPRCESTTDARIFEILVDGFAARSYTRLGVEPPTADRNIRLPDANGNILTDQSSVSALATVGALTGGSIAGGFGTIETDSIESRGQLTAAGRWVLGVTVIDTAATAQNTRAVISSSVAAVRLVGTSGLGAVDLWLPNQSEAVDGQLLTVINQSDRPAVASAIGLTVQASTGVATLIFLGEAAGGGPTSAGWVVITVA